MLGDLIINMAETTDGNTDVETEIKNSTINGQGTFAKKKINCGDYITTLTGELYATNEENLKWLCKAKGITIDDPLQVGEELHLILNYASKAINHSCDPNAGIRNASDLYAIKDIHIGDEITYDYSTTVDVRTEWNMYCSCNASICRKKIGAVLTIPPFILNKYLDHDVLPSFIKEQLKKAGRLKK